MQSETLGEITTQTLRECQPLITSSLSDGSGR